MWNFIDCMPDRQPKRDMPLLVPIYAADWDMAVLFEQEIYYAVGGKGDRKKNERMHNYSRLLNYDAQYDVYWVEIAPVSYRFSGLVTAGKKCFNIWYSAYLAGKTTWQFPFLNPAYETVNDWPVPKPPEEEISGVIIAFRGWGPFNDIDTVLFDPMRDYHFNPETEKFGASLTTYGAGFKCNPPYSPEYDGIDIMTDYINPMRSSILFELGVRVEYGSHLGWWSVKPHLQEMIDTRIKPRTKELTALAQKRHLLEREKWELEVLNRLVIPEGWDWREQGEFYAVVVEGLRKEVEEKTLDPILREKLLNLIDDAYQLYIYL